MKFSSDDRHPVELLAEEYVQRQRRGERPTLTEYAEQYPDWAEDIRDVFPTMLMMEQLKPSGSDMEPPPPLSMPEQLGDYRIVREIGRGGMGIVYEAVQQSLGRRVALKLLSGNTTLSQKRLTRFQREAQTAAQLHHTNIVPVFGVGEQDKLHYYVMQYISGKGLDSVLSVLREHDRLAPTATDAGDFHSSAAPRPDANDVSAQQLAQSLISGRSIHDTLGDSCWSTLEENRLGSQAESESASTSAEQTESAQIIFNPPSQLNRNPGAQYWRSIANIGVQVADALRYAHDQGTLHRDIKPANLLLNTQGIVWITDFGLAKLIEEEGITNSGDVVGTLCYMAPEQFEGQTDHRSDIYSLGLTLYELLTFQPAFDEIDRRRLIRQITQHTPLPPRKVNPHIPRDLETIVLKAIARELPHRYQDAGDLAHDLQCFLEDRPIQARRINPAERLWRWCRRNRALAALSGLALSLMLLVAVVMSFSYAHIRTAYHETAAALHRESLERQNADSERDRAEQTLEVALEAVDKVFRHVAPASVTQTVDTEIAESELLMPPQFEPVVSERDAALLQELLAVYDRLAERNRDTVAVQTQAAGSHFRVGEIQQRLGHYWEAEEAYLRAADVYETLGKSTSDNHFADELAAVHNTLGLLHQDWRRFKQAQSWHSKALAHYQSLASHPAATPEHQYRLVQTLMYVGMAQFMSFESEDAIQHLQRARSTIEKLIAEQGTSPEHRHLQAKCLWSLARVLGARRDWDESRAAFVKGREILEELSAEFPDVPQYAFDLVEIYLAMNAWRREASEREELLALFQHAVQTAVSLTKRFPLVPEYQSLLGRSQIKLGQFYRSNGDHTLALAEFRRGTDLQKSLSVKFPTVARYYFNLARAEHHVGETLCDTGELSEARIVLSEAIEHQYLYLKLYPESRASQWYLSRHHRVLAEALALLGEDRLAEDASSKATEILEKLRQPQSKRQATPRNQPKTPTGATNGS